MDLARSPLARPFPELPQIGGITAGGIGTEVPLETKIVHELFDQGFLI